MSASQRGSTFVSTFIVDAPAELVRAFHESPDAFRRLAPPLSFARIHHADPLGEGAVLDFSMMAGPLPVRWRAVHRDVGPGGFTDVQEAGPMAWWSHRHTYEALDDGHTLVRDEVTYAHPGLPRGLVTRLVFGRAGLNALFRYRALATRRAVKEMARHATGAGAAPPSLVERATRIVSRAVRGLKAALTADIPARRTLAAPPQAAWELLADTSNWTRWGPSVRAVSPPGLRLHDGATGRVQTALRVWAPFQVTEFVDGEAWRWRVGGIRATGHTVRPTRSGGAVVAFLVPVWAAPYVLLCWVALRRLDRLAREMPRPPAA